MSRRVAFTVALALAVVPLAASALLWVDKTTAAPCNRDAVFARTINPSPADAGYYVAADCETIFADGVTVILPPLSGATKLKQITVRNVGVRTVIVAARQPADVINPIVTGYTPTSPQQPILTGPVVAVFVHANESVTVTAMPTHLPNAWFVVSR